jgi:uncharacterized RDD family membrane protein YckC
MSSQLPPGVPGNPYAAPSARIDDLEVQTSNELASRGARLAAVVLDGVVVFVPAMILLLLMGVFGRDTMRPNTGPPVGFFLLIGLLFLIWAIVNLVFVFRYQQTIGKRICKIKVVRSDGSPCNPWRIILLRGFVVGLINNIPIVGGLFGLVDPLLIFREDHRCIHDHIADTIVVRA